MEDIILTWFVHMFFAVGDLDWFQIDLIVSHRITSIVTQGSFRTGYWCIQALFRTSDDMITWTDYTDADGNIRVSTGGGNKLPGELGNGVSGV